MKKKILTLVMITILALGILTGCGNSDKVKNGQATNMVCIALQPSAAFIPMMITRQTGN